jgi:hypothetical protein
VRRSQALAWLYQNAPAAKANRDTMPIRPAMTTRLHRGARIPAAVGLVSAGTGSTRQSVPDWTRDHGLC